MAQDLCSFIIGLSSFVRPHFNGLAVFVVLLLLQDVLKVWLIMVITGLFIRLLILSLVLINWQRIKMKV